MLLYDATHTSHTRAQTGIQRVCRSLFAELEKAQTVTGVCRDPYHHTWRTLSPGELSQLQAAGPASGSRSSRWSQSQRLIGRGRRLLGIRSELPAATGLICPEFFSAKVGPHLPELFKKINGPRVALFYDAIPLQFPELTPPDTVAWFPVYLRELLHFDGVAAISETSATVLRDYWKWLGVSHPPPVAAIPLATAPVPPSTTVAPAAHPPRLLSVGTIEGRKNHLALLEACEELWSAGQKFELQLIGLARPDTAARALDKIAALQAAGRPVIYDGVASDTQIHTAYRHCTFTVYPSLIEGFGLPVQESLGFGKPCICSARGALGESARAGGCVALEAMDAASIAAAIKHLLQHPEELATLSAAAGARNFPTWHDYAGHLTSWMNSLSRRA